MSADPASTGGDSYEYIPFVSPDFPVKVVLNKEMTGGELEKLAVPRWHEQTEIKYFLQGDAVIECDSKSFIAREGDTVIINPCERHCIRPLSGTPRYHLLMMDSGILRGYTPDAGDERLLPFTEGRLKFHNLISGSERIREILVQLFDELERRGEAYEFMVKGLLFLLFGELFRHEVSEIVDADYMAYIRKYSERISNSFCYISRNYNREISVPELAGACSISEYYFCRLFKNVTGKTPVDYLREYRVNKADVLLRTTNLSVGDIADMVGFKDHNYFSRCYRQVRGCSPAKTRRNGTAGNEQPSI